MFSNLTREFDYDEEDFRSQWFEDERGFLYIIGGPGRCDLALAPSNSIYENICLYLIDNGTNKLTEEQIAKLGLTEIPDILKRFDPKDGYYHA